VAKPKDTLNAYDPVCVFIQKRALRAGAQVSLSRIVTSEEAHALKPFILLADDGWLSSFFQENNIPCIVSPWPSPRSLGARLGSLKRFAHKFVQQLAEQGLIINTVVANDHQECLLAHAIAKAASKPKTIAILRSSNMSQRDFYKYRCADCDTLFTRGDALTTNVSRWSQHEASNMLGSFTDRDFFPLKEHTPSFPKKILIAGSEIPAKGFADIFDALTIISQKEPEFPVSEFTFTGKQTDALTSAIPAESPHTFTFAGRVANFPSFARQFDLAIHPSRQESFGMAPLELMLAGLPTMISITGIVSSLPLSYPWTFPPNSPEHLANCLIILWKDWSNYPFDSDGIQQFIRKKYHISQTTLALKQAILS